MDLEATNETVAALLGVASTSSRRIGGTSQGKHAVDAINNTNTTPSSLNPGPKANAYEKGSWNTNNGQQRPDGTDGGTSNSTDHAAPAHSVMHDDSNDSSSLLSMSSIGFGIDSSATAAWGDATEAAVRALQDAMERSTLRLPMTTPAHHLLKIKVQLGVPPKEQGSAELMAVDIARLTSVLPQAIPILPPKVTVGGLFLRGEAQGSPSICTAVACVTLQSQAPLSLPEPTLARSPQHVSSAQPHPNPWPAESHPPVSVKAPTPGDSGVSTMETEPTKFVSRSTPTSSFHVEEKAGPTIKQNVQRSTSIEMLAMISEEIRMAANKHRAEPNANSPSHEDGMESYMSTNSASASSSNGMVLNDDSKNGNYNYKKLPPGVTTKNNRRLFVKHNYRDYSCEKALPEEQDLVGSSSPSSSRTPNAAFPLKLHETLTQIENNGHGDIIGWMPHGRSFKILKQKEFAEIILPRYFVMTKKSSFLRQLNLYGFNRFSAGPDQGSYYHEKFLRGLKFLCRRMSRQKVNGNRIRSAGNPDEEPMLSGYPVCPPPQGDSSSSAGKRPTYVAITENDRVNRGDDDAEEDEEDAQEPGT